MLARAAPGTVLTSSVSSDDPAEQMRDLWSRHALQVVTFSGELVRQRARGRGCCAWAGSQTVWGELKGVAGTLALVGDARKRRGTGAAPEVIRLRDYEMRVGGIKVTPDGYEDQEGTPVKVTPESSQRSACWDVELTPIGDAPKGGVDRASAAVEHGSAPPVPIQLRCSHAWKDELEAWFRFVAVLPHVSYALCYDYTGPLFRTRITTCRCSLSQVRGGAGHEADVGRQLPLPG